MRFTDRLRMAAGRLWRRAGIARLRNALTGVALFAGCSTPLPPLRVPDGLPDRVPAEPATAGAPAAGHEAATGVPSGARPAAEPARIVLGPPETKRNWNEVRLQAAQRLIIANPNGSYTGPAPDPLLAIPVLEIELHADGRIRHIQVLRAPKQAKDTTQLAIAALHRAAPFGDVSRLPKPWRFTETFLFDDDRRFKPRTLD